MRAGQDVWAVQQEAHIAESLPLDQSLAMARFPLGGVPEAHFGQALGPSFADPQAVKVALLRRGLVERLHDGEGEYRLVLSRKGMGVRSSLWGAQSVMESPMLSGLDPDQARSLRAAAGRVIIPATTMVAAPARVDLPNIERRAWRLHMIGWLSLLLGLIGLGVLSGIGASQAEPRPVVTWLAAAVGVFLLGALIALACAVGLILMQRKARRALPLSGLEG